MNKIKINNNEIFNFLQKNCLRLLFWTFLHNSKPQFVEFFILHNNKQAVFDNNQNINQYVMSYMQIRVSKERFLR